MPPMQTDCSATRFEFGVLEGRGIEARFDGGAIASDAGGLLLGRVDKALGLTRRLAGCFVDRRDPALIEHSAPTLVGQRVFGLALGYEDLDDHDALRHDLSVRAAWPKVRVILRADSVLGLLTRGSARGPDGVVRGQ